MESLQKFECWQELSDEESATISGGTGVGTTITGPLGQTGLSLGQDGLGVKTGGTGGQTAVTLGPDGVSAEGSGIANSFKITLGLA